MPSPHDMDGLHVEHIATVKYVHLAKTWALTLDDHGEHGHCLVLAFCFSTPLVVVTAHGGRGKNMMGCCGDRQWKVPIPRETGG